MKKVGFFFIVLVLLIGVSLPVQALPDETNDTLMDTEICKFNDEILASDEECVELDIVSDGEEAENLEEPDDSAPIFSRQLVISEIAARICPEESPNCSNDEARTNAFVEIYNNSPVDFTLDGWRIQYASATANNNYQPGNYSNSSSNSVAISQSIEGFEWAVLPFAVGNATDGYLRIVDETGKEIDLVGWGKAANAKGERAALSMTTNNSIQRCELPDANGYLIDSGNSADDFAVYTSPTKGANVACIPPTPVNYCDGLELSEIAANVDSQFIEIYNPTAFDIDVADCQLMTNRNNNVKVLDGTLSPESYLVINIKDTALALTKTTTGTVYLFSSDGQKEIDSTFYSNLSKDTSWSLVDGEWRQTYQLTPNEANVWMAYPSCPAGQERNPETGRCRKIPEPEVLAPCPAGQYRNPETNRCRKFETSSTLTPCKEGYERNPLTNRCRKIVVEEDGLKPCAEGYERNPETNRCRKIVSTDSAAFAVQSGDPTGNGTAYVVAGIGVVSITAGMILFQFRTELMRALRRLRSKFPPIKKS